MLQDRVEALEAKLSRLTTLLAPQIKEAEQRIADEHAKLSAEPAAVTNYQDLNHPDEETAEEFAG